MSKAFRQAQIRKLVRARALHSQTELAEALHRAGVETTQVTLSRDLKELGLVKTPAGYADLAGSEHGEAAAEPEAPEIGHIVREFVRDLRPAQNLLVVKTAPGAAPTVGAAFDAAGWSEVAGSLAGDDTLLLVCAGPRQRLEIERRLRELLGS